ncbi:hypothetical protein BU17DRAFT_90632 [Hysterangium stoloniferum]|nr:hypothetical protein BU17DRAFT_90632 [Hysterangium stoloniferum]
MSLSVSNNVPHSSPGENPDTSSLASRNPTRDVIPKRSRVQLKCSNAERITANASHDLNKENANALRLEIEQFFEHRDREILRLSKKYHKSEINIKMLLSNESKYRNMRAPSLRNALVHAKGLEVNENCKQGDRLTLADIQKLVDDDVSMQNPSKDQCRELFENLQMHRDLKRTGVHISNAAAALDCQGAVSRVSTEIRDLSERTGMCSMVFFTRTHIHDTTIPSWADSDGAIAFVSEVLKLEPMEFLARFEQWACARIKSGSPQENLQTMRADCTRLIIEGLRVVLNIKNVTMSYIKYDCNIVSKYKVELVGWPASIKFANPSEIGTIDKIRTLRQALRVGDCKWIAQSQRQQAAHMEKLTVKEAAGELVVKKRKERSDKGKVRTKGSMKDVLPKGGQEGGRCMRDSENDKGPQQPPRKKRKHATMTMSNTAKQLPPTRNSKEFISDYDDDTNED